MESKTKRIILIIFVVAALILLVWFIFLRKDTYDPNNYNNKDVLDVAKTEYIVVGLHEHRIFTTNSGSKNFEIPIKFAPNDTQAWAMNNEGCKYNIQPVNQVGYCINEGWDSIIEDLSSGTSISAFETVEYGIGYSLIRINVPNGIQPCTQRFTIEVKCNIYSNENVKDYFDISVV
jgi:hypothetical protein